MTPTDLAAQAREWAERHDINLSPTDLLCAFEDAATLHLCQEQQTAVLTDERIVELRDSALPNQGEFFDCIIFARLIESEVRRTKGDAT
jgi:hypothetical protein